MISYTSLYTNLLLYALQTAVDYRERWHSLPHTSIVPETEGGDAALGKASAVHVVAPYLPALHEISSAHADRIYAAAAQKGEVEQGSYAQQAVAAAAANERAHTVQQQQQQQQQLQQQRTSVAATAPEDTAVASTAAITTATAPSVYVPTLGEVVPELCSMSIEVPAAVIRVPPIIAPAAPTTADVASVYVPPMVDVASEVAANEAAMRHKIRAQAPAISVIGRGGGSGTRTSSTESIAGSGCSSS
jgi:hypothetical protein